MVHLRDFAFLIIILCKDNKKQTHTANKDKESVWALSLLSLETVTTNTCAWNSCAAKQNSACGRDQRSNFFQEHYLKNSSLTRDSTNTKNTHTPKEANVQRKPLVSRLLFKLMWCASMEGSRGQGVQSRRARAAASSSKLAPYGNEQKTIVTESLSSGSFPPPRGLLTHRTRVFSVAVSRPKPPNKWPSQGFQFSAFFFLFTLFWGEQSLFWGPTLHKESRPKV